MEVVGANVCGALATGVVFCVGAVFAATVMVATMALAAVAGVAAMSAVAPGMAKGALMTVDADTRLALVAATPVEHLPVVVL